MIPMQSSSPKGITLVTQGIALVTFVAADVIPVVGVFFNRSCIDAILLMQFCGDRRSLHAFASTKKPARSIYFGPVLVSPSYPLDELDCLDDVHFLCQSLSSDVQTTLDRSDRRVELVAHFD